jgi:TetR/AcrR family transcriptional regulator
MPTPRKTKSTKTKGPGIGDRNRARILDAAVGVFARKGFDGARIAEIAQRSGLPKANVYYYFRNKHAIYETVIASLIAEWDHALSHLDAARDPADALASYIQAKLDFSRNRTTRSKMFANEVVHGGRFLSRAVLRHMKAWEKAGRMDPVEPLHLFILLWGSTQFYADFSVMARNALGVRRLDRAHFDAAAETITHVVAKGCGIRLKEHARPRASGIPLPQGSRPSRSFNNA